MHAELRDTHPCCFSVHELGHYGRGTSREVEFRSASRVLDGKLTVQRLPTQLLIEPSVKQDLSKFFFASKIEWHDRILPHATLTNRFRKHPCDIASAGFHSAENYAPRVELIAWIPAPMPPRRRTSVMTRFSRRKRCPITPQRSFIAARKPTHSLTSKFFRNAATPGTKAASLPGNLLRPRN